jgi:two-component system, NtrC family, response regulator PilR
MKKTPRILVVDDEADLRELFEITLIKMGLDVDTADCVTAAREMLAQTEYSMVITDMRLPDGLGMELVQEVSSKHKNTPIAVITAFGSTDNAVSALKTGAFDYISKPVSLNQLRAMVTSALRQNALVAGSETITLAKAPNAANPSRLTGESSAIQELRAQIARLARSMAPIAISGESGSGKELAAREIHALSARADKPFVAVNCGAIPESLMEAEFFGYRKGAFTGANDDRDGFFQAANGGTLMLDEVADLPLTMQVKLLRAIQERSVRKLGATAEELVDVRIISATHQNLADCVSKGTFRQDLYYRINVIGLNLPPLRERRDDIGALANTILSRLAGKGKSPAVLTPLALDTLKMYPFPGNVRELENILERAQAFANDGIIDVSDLALNAPDARVLDLLPASKPHEKTESAITTPPQAPLLELHLPDISHGLPVPLPEYLNAVEREIIRRALKQTRNNRTQAAQLLGLSFRQLRYQIQRLNIQDHES